MPDDTNNDFEDLKNMVVTISAYDMGKIIAKVMHEIDDSLPNTDNAIESAVYVKIIKMLGTFGASIMTEMFEDADTIEIE
jgi:ABC-type molybdate transport system permease subunit